MGRIRTGWTLLRGSLAVVGAVPALLVPGLVQALTTLALAAAVALSVDGDVGGVGDVGLLVGALVVSSVVGTLAAAVVVAVTAGRMDGAATTPRDGLRTVLPHLLPLVLWALLSATVGLVVRQVEERLGAVGRWLSWGLGTLLATATLLVVPVLVLEGAGVRESLRRSTALFRQRWGEATVGRAGVEVVLGLAFLVALVIVVAPLSLVGTVPAAAAAVVLLTAYLAVHATTTAVLSAALHRYAVTGVGGSFGDLGWLFVPREPAYQPSYAAPHGQWDAS